MCDKGKSGIYGCGCGPHHTALTEGCLTNKMEAFKEEILEDLNTYSNEFFELKESVASLNEKLDDTNRYLKVTDTKLNLMREEIVDVKEELQHSFRTLKGLMQKVQEHLQNYENGSYETGEDVSSIEYVTEDTKDLLKKEDSLDTCSWYIFEDGDRLEKTPTLVVQFSSSLMKENWLSKFREEKDVNVYKIPEYVITPIGERSELGEGPFWAKDTQMLYWVDMRKNVINSYNPATKKQVRVHINTDSSPVSLVVRVKGTTDRFVVGIKGALAVIRWDGKSTTELTPKYFADVEPPNSESRLNDGCVDPAGRLWVGSMGKQLTSNPNTFEKDRGSLYMIGPKGEVTHKVPYLQISNGIDWSMNADKLYLVDSLAYKVFEFDYNNQNGALGEKKTIFDLKDPENMVSNVNSLPDGMTVDEEDMLWVAVYGTQKVIRINPKTSQLLLEITIPKALEITSVAFGGKNLDILFVTSAMVDWTDELEAAYPDSGKLFMITGLGVKGRPSRDMVLDKCIWRDI